MFFHGADQQEPEAQADGDPGLDDQQQGDGLHHHEIHEDEGGGFRSMHTHPDGRQEPGEHISYEEARDHMDAMHGQGGEAQDDNPDMPMDDRDDSPSGDDAASAYRKSCEG